MTGRVGNPTAFAALLGASFVALLWAGCEEDPPPAPRYPVTFVATSDGQPLSGVTITIDDAPIGSTGVEGTLRHALIGPAGRERTFAARCPEGYRSPGRAQVLPAGGAADPNNLRVHFDCAREYHEAVVIVRTNDQPGLPIYIDDQERARTDASGIAHVHIPRLAPETSFQVRIATASVNERLRPVEPTETYRIGHQDQIFVFDREFIEERVRRRGGRRNRRQERTRPRIPQPIRGSH